MATYIIGDIQGCYLSLSRLIGQIGFNADCDKLWFAGDLVNRGPDSLKTLKFVKSLGEQAVCVLGNHDLHLLAAYYSGGTMKPSDTLQPVLDAPEVDDLMDWLRHRPLFHHDIDLNFSLVHAGVYPGWSISRCLSLAAEVETELRSDRAPAFFAAMYGNKPGQWSESLAGMDRIRMIVNVFTRMRYLNEDLSLDFLSKGGPEKIQSSTVQPWFSFKQSAIKHNRVAFGHWSTLATGQYGNCFALDSGCVWGGQLTALRVDKKTPRWISQTCPGINRPSP